MPIQVEKSVVLFVDDDKVISQVTGKYLSSLGYRVVLATDGKQALELFDELKPQSWLPTCACR